MTSSSTNISSSQGSSRRLASPREFFVTVELYLSPKAASVLPKPFSSHRKNDRRESSRQLSIADDSGSQKKLKEKSSWLSIGRSSPSLGQWRTATCKLTEEEEGSLLNIYIDETILHQSVYVYLLNHADIRPVDRSLFDRNDCIGIHCVPGQRWSAMAATDPIILAFPNSDTLNTWIILLRSYATPEVYGQRINAAEGGLYRMWRQIEINCIQARNLGINRPPTEGALESPQDSEAADQDVFLEIYINNMLSGRTTTKRSVLSHDWHENFLISDLPPFENLEIAVFREKRTLKPISIGNVVITLGNFRRGEYVEGWFPVIDSVMSNVGTQVGEIRLKLKVDEEIILPQYEYSGILQILNARNYLDWVNDLTTKLHLKDVSSQFISIAVIMNTLVQNICEIADREVQRTSSSQNTLFRGNTVLTKTIELFMEWHGKAFLEASVGGVIRKIYKDKVSIEIDPARAGKTSTRDIEKNVDILVHWCTKIWDSIYVVRNDCPYEMRRLFEHIRKLVEDRSRNNESQPDQQPDLPRQSVSVFCFLRFIVPAILHPHLFGLVAGLPDLAVQRSLTLIAKVIQSLANLNPNVQKEDFMRGVQDFLIDSRPAMIDYILVVSSPGPEPHAQQSAVVPSERSNRSRVIESLRQRGRSMPLLHREAIPLLPYLLDTPRHLAIIASAVVRSSRGYHETSQAEFSQNPELFEFCDKCYEIEEHALRRVSRLTGRQTAGASRKRPSTVNLSTPSPSIIPLSPASSMLQTMGSPKSRPFTAPSPSTKSNKDHLSLPQLPGCVSTSQLDVSTDSISIRNRSRSRHGARYPSIDDPTALRRVQTLESSSPTHLESSAEAAEKRKGFFRTLLSRKSAVHDK